MTEQLFNFDLKKISNFSKNDVTNRENNLKLFLENGLPNKKDEDWKFTDLNFIIKKNFNNIFINEDIKIYEKIDLIKDFDHNHIILVNGYYHSSDMRFEEKGKVIIKRLNTFENFKYNSGNNLSLLNRAL